MNRSSRNNNGLSPRLTGATRNGGESGGITPRFNAPSRGLGTGAQASGASAIPPRPKIEFIGQGGQPLPLYFGKHVVAGQLIFKIYEDSTPKLAFCTALADGGEKGLEAADAVVFADTDLSVSADTTPGYRFHPGTLSTGLADADQGQDAFFTNALTFNNTAYLAVSLSPSLSTEDRADKIRAAISGLLCPDFDEVGILTGWSYSANPARVAAYGVWHDTRIKYPDASDYELSVIVSRRVDWVTWYRLKTICDEEIEWDDGTTTRDIPRFECHLQYPITASLMAFLNAVCATCASWPQDDNGVIRFVTPFDSPFAAPYDVISQHHFSDGSDDRQCNLLTTPTVEPVPLRERPRSLTARFGDTDDTWMQEGSVTWPRDDDRTLVEQFGEQENTVRDFPNMTYSQAERLLRRQFLLESTYATTATINGHGDALHLLPGDFVTVTSARHGWSFQRCLVTAVDLEPAETSVDGVTLTVQKIDGSLYDDTWHSEKQVSVEAE